MAKLFWYKVEKMVTYKDENDLDEKGNPKVTQVKKPFYESFNVDCVIRATYIDENTLAVLLNDGHEQSDDVQKPVMNKSGKMVMETKRERQWFYSQISLTGDDIQRFQDVTSIDGFAKAPMNESVLMND